MSKKILFVVNVDWFFISHRLPLALEALKRGYEVHIACGITDKKEYLESLGLKVHPLNLSRSGTGIKGEIKAFFEIYRILKEINPNIAHFVTIKPVLYGGIASRFLSIHKKVFSISGLGFIFIKQGLKARLVRMLIKTMYKFALGGKNSHVIVQNPDDKAVVNSIVKVYITLIRGSGVDLSQYQYIDENINIIKVSMACRLLKDKGVFEYIDAAKILKQKLPNVEFEIYGDIDIHNPASLTNDDIKKIKEEGFVNVYGFSIDIAKVFCDSNIVVLPSYREGLPKVLIEAAACGRAVVTTDVPGCRDAIEPNVTGLLCEVKDIESLARMIEKLIIDEKLRNRMGYEGRKLAEQEFDINKVVEKHFDIYEGRI
ncbi:glycosyltransferase family 4 protein [Aliarcobacter butzleri]|uniref:Glycosyltransferase family 4 protein n=1 Tax=Aliarcobacter butzleri TaxID=28197 RepID=A0AAP4Q0F3_9BACT|nr:glycosyltransferase family 4 protein [Aliarcobacter butzleri]MDN5053000.1 glycosyltransferase family 4 protein [Aliarcobacter butzleri]MDN5076016.1 glycosyltransferase family 4 protein [Aliarcobacter butzleri]MDN5117377.1 glycosyltransferase family 4 protein [Aliarcobacter butzleri]MDN5133247.1 glycosyltransferase family 4 protein [Aliarcobacter butzleri]NUW26519.1 glycosyltransferase family 4 protein [Aliarcobacter butzleri]